MSLDDPLIRLGRPEDRPAIEAIVKDSYAPYISRIGREPGPMLDDYEALIREERVHVLVDEDVIQGLVVLIPDDRAMLLDNVAVSPGAQGLGYGRKLLEFAERSALAAHCESIRLYTNEAMIENIALYSRIGFVETHRATEMGLRRVHMRKQLV
jgi:ribosomal protein S18 acetylase RimI-like enzyme